jgi:hypothetical protein
MQSSKRKATENDRLIVPIQARLDAPETLHHVIIRGIEQRQIVDDDKDRKNFAIRLG